MWFKRREHDFIKFPEQRLLNQHLQVLQEFRWWQENCLSEEGTLSGTRLASSDPSADGQTGKEEREAGTWQKDGQEGQKIRY